MKLYGISKLNNKEELMEKAKKTAEEKAEENAGNGVNDKPGLEFTPLTSGAFDDIAHNRIVQCIKNTCSNHDCRNST